LDKLGAGVLKTDKRLSDQNLFTFLDKILMLSRKKFIAAGIKPKEVLILERIRMILIKNPAESIDSSN
tara:strand:+ start:172 stop:375 length:204 start_codon:yes stop_codon:yes gene_type:complete